MTLADVYAMPASEFAGWQAYFGIYPFTFQQRDIHAAQIAAAITNSIDKLIAAFAGKKKYALTPMQKFLPDYLGTQRKIVTDPMQRAEYAAFKAKLAAAKGILEIEPGIPDPSTQN